MYMLRSTVVHDLRRKHVCNAELGIPIIYVGRQLNLEILCIHQYLNILGVGINIIVTITITTILVFRKGTRCLMMKL